MTIPALSTLPAGSVPPEPLPEGRGDFPAMLRRAQGPDEARDAAERFVAMTLVEPILKQVRQSTGAAPPFGPAPGEVQFRALLDAEIARKVVSASNFPLVDRVARDLRARGGES